MGYISKEDRKKRLEHEVVGYTFTSCLDLSTGVKVTRAWYADKSPAGLSRAVAVFTGWWMCNIHRELNGFSGLDTIRWIFEEEEQL